MHGAGQSCAESKAQLVRRSESNAQLVGRQCMDLVIHDFEASQAVQTQFVDRVVHDPSTKGKRSDDYA